MVEFINQLYEKYSTMPKVDINISCNTPKDILRSIDKELNGNWAYTIINEENLESYFTITTLLFLPGRMPIPGRYSVSARPDIDTVNEMHLYAIYNSLLSMGLINRKEEVKQPKPKTEKIGICVDDMTAEEFNKMSETVGKEMEDYKNVTNIPDPIVIPFQYRGLTPEQVLESSEEIISKHGKAVFDAVIAQATSVSDTTTQTAPARSPIYPPINIQYKNGENEQAFIQRLSKELETAFQALRPQLPNIPKLTTVTCDKAPNDITAMVQAYVFSLYETENGKQSNPLSENHTDDNLSWLSKTQIDIGKDVEFGITDLERKAWSHFTSEEIYLEKIIDWFMTKIPQSLIPMITRNSKDSEFKSMFYVKDNQTFIDSRIYIRLKLMGYHPTLENPYGELGAAPAITPKQQAYIDEQNEKLGKVPTPPMSMDFNNPPDKTCPSEMTEELKTGWNEDHTIKTEVQANQLQFYVPPKNKLPFVAANKNDSGVPINQWGYTELQMDRMQSFKEQHEITDDAKFNLYVQTWSSKKLNSKNDIGTHNIDEFLTWVEQLALGKPLWR